MGSGGVGFWVAEAGRAWAGGRAVEEVPTYEYFLRESSFSEVTMAKDTLQASAARLVAQLQQDGTWVALRMSRGAEGMGPRLRGDLRRVEAGLRAGLEEFRGTEQEMFLYQHLLWSLHAREAWEEWFELYLEVLYLHPGRELVARGAAESRRVACLLGREAALEDAIRFLRACPLDLPAKRAFAESEREAGKGEALGPH